MREGCRRALLCFFRLVFSTTRDRLALDDVAGKFNPAWERFQRAVAGQAPVEVTLDDGLWAAFMGQTAQEAAASKRVIEVPPIRQAERITA